MNILTAKNLSFSYDKIPVVSNWSAQVDAQKIYHLQGANGSGKSTLLRLLAGILCPESGEVNACLSAPFSYPIAYVGHRLGLHPYLSVVENINLDIVSHCNPVAMLESVNLHTKQHALVATLSVGQKQKVALLKMITQQAMLWIMDEPLANLDEQGEAWLWGQINRHLDLGGAVILTAHQRHFDHIGVNTWHMA